MLFDTKATLVAQASLDALWLKTQVITNNLANADTPGFKSSSVSFEEQLRHARTVQTRDGAQLTKRAYQAGQGAAQVLQTRDGAVQSWNGGAGGGAYQAYVSTDNTSAVREDGNNVALEKEQTELWKTYAQYSYLLDRMAGHYRGINSAISGMRT